MNPRPAKAYVNGHWQDVMFHGLFQVMDIQYAQVLAVVETKSGKLRKVDLPKIELKPSEDGQLKIE